MIDVKKVRELIELMVEHELSEIRVRQGDTAVSLRKGSTGETIVTMPAPGPGLPPPAAVPVPGQATSAPPSPAEDDTLVPIASPMVGTYYASPEPDAPVFVSVGAEITADSTVCIIEAMKVFNEIKAEVNGTIERILVKNEQAVEYGQPLMLVRPKT